MPRLPIAIPILFLFLSSSFQLFRPVPSIAIWKSDSEPYLQKLTGSKVMKVDAAVLLQLLLADFTEVTVKLKTRGHEVASGGKTCKSR